MIEVEIPDASGRILNAKVEIGGAAIVLHSRSGKARNPEYRLALEAILQRLQREGIKPEVFLDSAPVQGRPLASRRLAGPSDLKGNIAEQFDFLIDRSNAGSASHGAWRRLLLQVPRMPDYALKAILDGSARAREASMTADQLALVKRSHLDAAIVELRSGAERHTRFDEATGYLLLPPDGGAPLPPKKVFGIALAEVLQTYTTPQDFSSGEQIFAIMRERGLEVVSMAMVREPEAPRPPSKKQVDDAIADMPLTDEERSWVEGNIKVATHLRRERSGTLSKQFKADFHATNGRLFCERCSRDYIDDYGVTAAEACFEVHHTIPIAKMTPGHETTSDQLRLLCANCHRATHREMGKG